VLQLEEQLVRFLGLRGFVDDGAQGAHHRDRMVSLPHVAAHIDAGRAFLDGAVGEPQRVELGVELGPPR
jgi:hypothetical protein